MLPRIAAVVSCILIAVWLARAPDWEPLAALSAALLCYVGAEIASYRQTKKNKQEYDALCRSEQMIQETCRKIQRGDPS